MLLPPWRFHQAQIPNLGREMTVNLWNVSEDFFWNQFLVSRIHCKDREMSKTIGKRDARLIICAWIGVKQETWKRGMFLMDHSWKATQKIVLLGFGRVSTLHQQAMRRLCRQHGWQPKTWVMPERWRSCCRQVLPDGLQIAVRQFVRRRGEETKHLLMFFLNLLASANRSWSMMFSKCTGFECFFDLSNCTDHPGPFAGRGMWRDPGSLCTVVFAASAEAIARLHHWW